MSRKHDNQAIDICKAASASGKITRDGVNILRRSFVLLSDATKATVRAVDASIIKGATKIIEDGSGVFDQKGNRQRRR